jgi:hypothetical protein
MTSYAVGVLDAGRVVHIQHARRALHLALRRSRRNPHPTGTPPSGRRGRWWRMAACQTGPPQAPLKRLQAIAVLSANALAPAFCKRRMDAP